MQQLTCNMVLLFSFYYLSFSFSLFELKPLSYKKSLGDNSEKGKFLESAKM